jgi:flagellar biogenesis protein FliO
MKEETKRILILLSIVVFILVGIYLLLRLGASNIIPEVMNGRTFGW